MDIVDPVKVLGNIACVKCKYGDDCDMTDIRKMLGPEASKSSAVINRFEEQFKAVDAAKELGKNFAGKLKSKE